MTANQDGMGSESARGSWGLWRKGVTWAFACLLVVVPSGRLLAHDHHPPKPPLLLSSSDVQAGKKIHSWWAKRLNEEECQFDDVFDWTTFPGPVAHNPGEDVVIQLRKQAMPLEWSISGWRKTGKNGRPKGQVEAIAAWIEPRSRADRIAGWNLRFIPPLISGHLLLRAEVYWADEDLCSGWPDLGSQTATWTFHLEAAP